MVIRKDGKGSMLTGPSGPMNPNDYSKPAQIPGFTNTNPRKRSAIVLKKIYIYIIYVCMYSTEAMKQCYTFRSTSAN